MNNNDNPATPSQNKLILAYLQGGNSLTGIEALEMFGCFRLPSRINDLRNMGHSIESDRVLLPNGKRVARYKIRL